MASRVLTSNTVDRLSVVVSCRFLAPSICCLVVWVVAKMKTLKIRFGLTLSCGVSVTCSTEWLIVKD